MDWLAYEELESEWNARYDYLAELAYEHRDWAAEADDYQDQVLDENWAPQHDAHVQDWYLHTDYVPF